MAHDPAPTQAGSSDRRHAIVVGAGLGGSLMACFLARAGWRVTVLERRSDPRQAGFIGGRSINLALSTRGIDALRRVDLADAVLAEGIPMRGRMMHSTAGQLKFQPYSTNPDDAIYSVSRSNLNLTLLHAAASHDHVSLLFDRPCTQVDLDAPAITVTHATTGETEVLTADLIIGADGAFSAVRAQMQRTDRFNYSQTYLEHGYKELTIPPAGEIPGCDENRFDGFALDPHALHIWPRGGSMMIALPNRDRSFTCTLFWPFEHDDSAQPSFERVRTADDVRDCFERWYPDAAPLISALTEEYLNNPTGSLVTVRCNPWQIGGRVVLLGDAAHAVVPFYGQGMNAAFEDCAALDACLKEFPDTLERAVATYAERREPQGHAIADLALHNFIVMRDRTASRAFLWRKRIEGWLHRCFPRWWVPLYNLVTFSQVPYAEAQRRGRRQDRWFEAAMVAGGAVLLLCILILVRWLIVSNR